MLVQAPLKKPLTPSCLKMVCTGVGVAAQGREREGRGGEGSKEEGKGQRQTAGVRGEAAPDSGCAYKVLA